jgi:hypothetical protein
MPVSRNFEIHVVFKGAAGAKLWLDDASPLPVTYMTIPTEWSRAVRAREFLRSLPAHPELSPSVE